MSPEESNARSKAEEAMMSTDQSKAGSEEMRGVDQTRRALIRAGWVIPVVIATQLTQPSNVFAAHSDVPSTVHGDTPATTHGDSPAFSHIDIPGSIFTPHTDIGPFPHTDIPGFPHTDTPATPHTDSTSSNP